MEHNKDLIPENNKTEKEHHAETPSTEEKMVPVFLPPLLILLQAQEKQKGTPLTEEEVLHIRDTAICMAMRQSSADEMARTRGFNDIAPDTCWEAWCAYKKENNQ